MATYTTNYNLKKPAGTDLYAVGDFNDNADKIDAGMFAMGKALSRKNLLDNWYFPTAVNQRGQTEWSTSYSGITVDRWAKFGTTGYVVWGEADSSITLAQQGGSTGQAMLFQRLDEGTFNLIRRNKFTVTVICEDIAGTATLVYSGIGSPITTIANLTDGINTFTFQGPTSFYPSSGTKPLIGVSIVGADATVSVIAIKMELGETQTLARVVDGSIVLNDLPDYKEQLLRCKRFYQVIEYGVFPGYVVSYSSNYSLLVSVPLQVDMDQSIQNVVVSYDSGTTPLWRLSDDSGGSVTAVNKYGVASNQPVNGCYLVCCVGAMTSSQSGMAGTVRRLTAILSTNEED